MKRKKIKKFIGDIEKMLVMVPVAIKENPSFQIMIGSKNYDGLKALGSKTPKELIEMKYKGFPLVKIGK